MSLVVALCLSTLGFAEEKYASKDGKYTATFPDKPKESSTPGDPAAGKYAFFSTSLEVTKDTAFMVMYHDYPEGVLKDEPALVLERVRDGTKGMTGRVIEDREIALGGNNVPGRAFTLKYPDSHYRARIYLKGNRLYQVIIVGKTKEDVSSKQADQFIDSFAIVP